MIFYGMKKKAKKRSLFTLSSLLFLSCFSLYLHHLSTSVYGGDSGDLLSAIAVVGVAHPSGYPLYTLLGIALSFFPITATLAWKVGIGSAFFSAFTVLLLYKIVWYTWKNILYALIASLTLAFSFPFWLHAEITEVIPLHLFFLALLSYLAILYRSTQKRIYLFMLAFFVGLSLTNNESILLLFPPLLLFIFSNLLRSFRSVKTLLFCVLLFLCGLLPYLYIPIAAAAQPPVNWNNPVTLENFLHLVLRKDYGWVTSSVVSWSVRFFALKQYASYLFSELPLFVFFLLPVGVVWSFILKSGRSLAVFYLLTFIAFGPFFLMYGAGVSYDLFSQGVREKFYPTSLLFLLLFLPYGIDAVRVLLSRVLKKAGVTDRRLLVYQNAFVIFFLIIPLLLFLRNNTVLDLGKSVTVTEVFAREILAPLPPNSVLIAQHDNVLFPVWYEQHAKGFKKNVYAIVPSEIKDLAARGMLHLTPNPLETALKKDSDPDNDVHTIALRLSAPVFISESDYHSFVKNGVIVLYPYGLSLRYANASEQKMDKQTFLARQEMLLQELSNPSTLLSEEKRERLLLLKNVPLFYAHAYTNTGYFLLYAFHDYPEAKKYFEKAIQIDSADDWGYEGLGIVYYKQKQYAKAREAFASAVAIQPLNHNAYFLLYKTAVVLRDKQQQKELEDFFETYHEIYTKFSYDKTTVRLP